MELLYDSFLLMLLVSVVTSSNYTKCEVCAKPSTSGFSAVNGTSTTLTWTFNFPPGRSSAFFRVLEGNLKVIASFYQGDAATIGNTQKLSGRVSNLLPTGIKNSTNSFNVTIGPLTMDDNGLVIINYLLYDNNIYVQSYNVLEVIGKPPRIIGSDITAKGCILVEFSHVDVGYCDVTYTIKYDLPGGSSVIKEDGNTNSNLNCDEDVKNATNVYVRSSFQGKQGVFSTSYVPVKRLPPPTPHNKDHTLTVIVAVVAVVVTSMFWRVAMYFVIKRQSVTNQSDQYDDVVVPNAQQADYTAMEILATAHDTEYELPTRTNVDYEYPPPTINNSGYEVTTQNNSSEMPEPTYLEINA